MPPEISNEPTLTPTTSLISETTSAAAEEFKPDPAKSEADNATAKAAWQKTQDDAKAKAEADKKAAETPEAKAAREKQEKEAAEKTSKDEANKVTKENPFKPEEIKLPEGFTVDEPTQSEFVNIVNEESIPRSAVAKLVALQAKVQKAASEAGSKLYADMHADWQKQAAADPDIGGDKLKPALAGISKLVDQAPDSKAVREALDLTGAGNHPAIIKWLNKIVPMFTEPNAAPSGTPKAPELSHADRIYDAGKK